MQQQEEEEQPVAAAAAARVRGEYVQACVEGDAVSPRETPYRPGDFVVSLIDAIRERAPWSRTPAHKRLRNFRRTRQARGYSHGAAAAAGAAAATTGVDRFILDDYVFCNPLWGQHRHKPTPVASEFHAHWIVESIVDPGTRLMGSAEWAQLRREPGPVERSVRDRL